MVSGYLRTFISWANKRKKGLEARLFPLSLSCRLHFQEIIYVQRIRFCFILPVLLTSRVIDANYVHFLRLVIILLILISFGLLWGHPCTTNTSFGWLWGHPCFVYKSNPVYTITFWARHGRANSLVRVPLFFGTANSDSVNGAGSAPVPRFFYFYT